MKKYTVKELAHLLDEYYICITFSDDHSNWSIPEMFVTMREVIDKYGEHTIKWISFYASEDEIYQAIELEGDRE